MTGTQASIALTVTSFSAGPYGGGIVHGSDDTGRHWDVVVGRGRAARDPASGERWRFVGELHAAISGNRLLAARALPMLPTGGGLVRYLAENPHIAGVGSAYAQRLWERFGERLYAILRDRDVSALQTVVGPILAHNIVLGWGLYTEDVETFAWLDGCGIAPRTALQVVLLWGAAAKRRLEENPYDLSLLESWQAVDDAALRAGLLPTDPRRLSAAIEEACARRFAQKHTAATLRELRSELGAILHNAPETIDAAVERGRATRRLIEVGDDLFQARGPHEMERFVASAIEERLAHAPGDFSSAQVGQALSSAEVAMGHSLTEQQRQAVLQALSSPVSALCGGAGTGKTAALRALLVAAKGCLGRDYPVHQVALAGRAAKRMTEATGVEASTVYRFLLDIRLGRRSASDGLLVIDEASMLDLPSVYDVLRAVSPSMRLLFVGDPAQLPPIGPGLVFHRMVLSRRIPRVELTSIQRQKEETGIPLAGAAIRAGRWPQFRDFDSAVARHRGVFFRDASVGDVADATVHVLEAMAGAPVASGIRERDVQLLCATKRGDAGTNSLNDIVERAYVPRTDNAQVQWGLSEGSKVLWTANDHQRGTRDEPRSLLNGALGFVGRLDETGATTDFDDGTRDVLRRDDLRKLDRGWAISIHKAQGSAFRHVIVPVVPSRLLDRALVYTALTRAIESVVFVGDREVLRAAIARPTSAAHRRIGPVMLNL